ncbi:hypothetical protein OG976_02290 [Mycobacterium sp. NBC_00419]|uniref:hypothetical protein n=1 Tax=Mycobacterium sp. NBC_00419 TaxID=2975989 RepID=UPI002E2319F7
MPETVGLDTAALRALTDRAAQAATDLSAVSIPGVAALAGSALETAQAPRRATADVRRHATAVADWVSAARRCIEELSAAEQAHAEGLRLR